MVENIILLFGEKDHEDETKKRRRRKTKRSGLMILLNEYACIF